MVEVSRQVVKKGELFYTEISFVVDKNAVNMLIYLDK